MSIQNLPNDVLISSYVKAVRKELDQEFIIMLLNEIKRRKLGHYLRHQDIPVPSKTE